MIVECPHCKQLLQTAQASLPDIPDLNVRCPLCSGEGKLSGVTSTKDAPSVVEGIRKNQTRQAEDVMKAGQTFPSDLTIPEDAFNHFRFPAETEASRERVPRLGASFRKPLFVLASILVVIFFTALVNIILPGPRPYSVEHTGLPVDVNFNESSGVVNR